MTETPNDPNATHANPLGRPVQRRVIPRGFARPTEDCFDPIHGRTPEEYHELLKRGGFPYLIITDPRPASDLYESVGKDAFQNRSFDWSVG